MKKFFMFVFGLSLLINAQEQLIFDRTYSYTFPFSADFLRDSLANSSFLSTLASIQHKSSQFLQFSLHGNIQHKIYLIDTIAYKILLVLKDMTWQGNVFYRNISLSSSLLPQFTAFKIMLYSKDLASPIRIIKHYQKLINKQGYVELAQIILPRDSVEIHAIKADHFSFFYTNQGVENLMAFKTLIDEYYLTKQKLIEFDSTLQTIDTTNIEKLPFFAIDVKTIGKNLEKIKTQDFFNKLQLWENDPLQFTITLENFEKKYSIFSTKMQQKLNQYEILLYNSALQLRPDSASKIYKKIIATNPAFSPAYYRLIDIFLQKNQLDSAFIYWQKTLFLSTPDSLIRYFSNVVERLHNQHQQQASISIQQDDFYTALELLRKDSLICESQTIYTCNDDWKKLLAQSHYGMYKSFLTIAQKAFDQNKPLIAYRFLKNAWNYQKSHASYILTNLEVKNFFEKLFTLLLAELEKNFTYSEANSFAAKLATLDTIATYYLERKDHSLDAHKKMLEKKLLHASCQQVLTLYSKKQFAQANYLYENIFDKLLEHQNDSSLIIPWKKIIPFRYQFIEHQLSSVNVPLEEKRRLLLEQRLYAQIDTFSFNENLLKIVSSQLFEEKISQYEKHINIPDSLVIIENDLTRLQQLLLESGNSTPLNQKWEQFISTFQQQKCLLLKKQQELTRDSIKKLIETKQHYKALAMIDHLVNSSEKQGCVEDAHRWKTIQNKLQTVSIQVDFLESMQHKLTKTSPQEDWNVFFRQYLQTYSTIQNLKLDSFGFVLPPLPQWLVRQSDIWLDRCFTFLIETELFLLALDLLRELRKNQYPRKKTTPWQNSLAERMAVKDIFSDTKDYKKQCLIYTQGDAYFEYFRKAYFRVWKKYSRP